MMEESYWTGPMEFYTDDAPEWSDRTEGRIFSEALEL